MAASSWQIDPASQRLARARWLPSPNHDERPPGSAIELLVVHAISLPPDQFGGPWIDALFTNTLDPAAHPYFATIAGLSVSAHCCIFRDGSVTQYVPFDRRAWHAGASSWRGRTRANDFSVGIELEGCDMQGFEAAQYRSLADVTVALLAAYPTLRSDAIVGHSDIAPGRKTDPGPGFDWPRLRSLM
ncbi:MAG: N-acetylmuramyl-L-alanine amidase, negative regulator of AmpC, AmpD [Hydrocarboniphaga sp.]|uniref:1,6-anhydro-N-acetylmuramyl-L-alanine amidase AmpD n=1 Tax=Hydrocarboniphaga sp. TaxID=2033016 RepID=UPI002639D17C|nr:1,6-anhydro-N-acetylmuramyl-L-alanine amidase AmpD [Hydrocarboniphaga sp.]MDB5972060.1 N-acetylmuramyl-L-alanine amidase, negative regulator of AmpC, AmpD [Hydrocarboniphaga sp.]